MILRLLNDVLGTSIVHQKTNTAYQLPYNMAACNWWPCLQNLVTSLNLIRSLSDSFDNIANVCYHELHSCITLHTAKPTSILIVRLLTSLQCH